MVLSVNANYIFSLGVNFPIAHTSVTQENGFKTICVSISVLRLRFPEVFLLVRAGGNLNNWGRARTGCSN